jgi:riboflavin kinase
MNELKCDKIMKSLFTGDNYLVEYLIDDRNFNKLLEYIKMNCDKLMLKFKEGVEISGTYVSGLGKANIFISDPYYYDRFKEILNDEPYPGTLNLKLEKIYKNLIFFLKKFQNIVIEGDKDHGAVLIYNCKIFDEKCVLIFPEKSNYVDTIEIVSSKKLSEYYKMKMGEKYKIYVYINFK